MLILEVCDKTCSICGGTGKRLIQGIEVQCSCVGLGIYGKDINTLKDASTDNNLTVDTKNSLIDSEYYTNIYNNINNLDLYDLIKSSKEFANSKGLELVGADNYLKLCNSILERSKQGDILKRSVLLAACNGFALDLVGQHLVNNYRLKGIKVPNVLTCVELMSMRKSNFDMWSEYVNMDIVVVKLTGADLNTIFSILFNLLNTRSVKNLPTVFLSQHNISELLAYVDTQDKSYTTKLLGMLNSNMYDPYGTVLTADVYFKVGGLDV